MSINFYLEKRPNKAGENPIRAQVSIRSSVLISTIGYSVNPDVWNGGQVDERLVAAWYKKQKKSDKDAVKVGRGQRKPYVNSKGVTDVTINQELIRIKAHFADYEEGIDHKPSKEELKNQLLIALKKMPEKTTATTGKAPSQKAAASLFDNFDEFTREQGLVNQWAYATRQTWKTFKNHLLAFARPWITDWPEHLARLERTAESHDRCTPTELANWNKVSRQTVYNWRDRGLLVYDAKKRIDVPATVALWRFLSKLR